MNEFAENRNHSQMADQQTLTAKVNALRMGAKSVEEMVGVLSSRIRGSGIRGSGTNVPVGRRVDEGAMIPLTTCIELALDDLAAARKIVEELLKEI